MGDIRDTAAVESLLSQTRPHFVFHLAAQAIVSAAYAEPIDTISVNVLGTASVLQALRKVEHPCVAVIVASDKCYENVEQPWGYREIDTLGGKDVYSASKGAAEIIFSSFSRSFFGAGHPVRMASARAGNVIGGGDWAADRIVADCVRAWMRGEPVRLRRPDSVRPWQHVLEPLSGYLALAARLQSDPARHGQAYNFGPRPERNRTVLELLAELAQIWGHPDPPRSYEVLERPPFAEAELLLLNCDKARADLAWEATLTGAETVRLTGEWYREVRDTPDRASETTHRQIADYVALARDRGRAWAVGAGEPRPTA